MCSKCHCNFLLYRENCFLSIAFLIQEILPFIFILSNMSYNFCEKKKSLLYQKRMKLRRDLIKMFDFPLKISQDGRREKYDVFIFESHFDELTL